MQPVRCVYFKTCYSVHGIFRIISRVSRNMHHEEEKKNINSHYLLVHIKTVWKLSDSDLTSELVIYPQNCNHF